MRRLLLLVLLATGCAHAHSEDIGFYTHCTTPGGVLMFQGHGHGYGAEQPEAWVFRGMRMTVADSAGMLTTSAAPFTIVIRQGPQFDAGGGMVTTGQFQHLRSGVWQGPSFCPMLGVPEADSTITLMYAER